VREREGAGSCCGCCVCVRLCVRVCVFSVWLFFFCDDRISFSDFDS
jgi:hypothetical protein